jgi:hypothetical protein
MTYEIDFYAWTQEQAQLMRDGKNHEIDYVNLIDEIECLGNSNRRHLMRYITTLLHHLLRYQYMDGSRCRNWKMIICYYRDFITDMLEDSPSLKAKAEDKLQGCWKNAVEYFVLETGVYKENVPEVCPWTFEKIIDQEFIPNGNLKMDTP